MKSLTLMQPWADLILSGRKVVENRSWPTRFRGQLVIHAGVNQKYINDRDELEAVYGDVVPATFELGALLGTVDLVDCVPVESRPRCPWSSGPWCWVLERPVRFVKPIPYSGRLGLWNVPDDRLP